MKTIDTRDVTRYSPLIPAVTALCEATAGEQLEIIMSDPQAFNDLKEYLAEQGIGFREIYDGEELSVEFRKP
ncbi:MAG: sulfurtransferase TusA family protein [Bacteroides sp.]|nr:sulfurtransferase TusA family protein [Bacteroides sp.]